MMKMLGVLALTASIPLSSLGCAEEPTAAPLAPHQDAGVSDAAEASDAAGGDASPTGDGTRPTVVSSDPAEGATPYAHLIFDAAGKPATRTIRVQFSEPMDARVKTVEMVAGDTRFSLPVAWIDDDTVLVARVESRELSYAWGSASSQFRYDANHRVDLRGLRDRSGEPLDTTTLGDGALDFSTPPKDRLLEHTCGHLQEPLFATLVLTAPNAAQTPPRIATPHKRYTVAFPPGQAEGNATFRIAGTGEVNAFMVSLYLDQSVRTLVTRTSDGAAIAMSAIEETPPICPQLSALRRFPAWELESYDITFVGDGTRSSFELIFEQDQL